MMIFKQSIPRRTFLRGLGASVALPMLDAMFRSAASSYKDSARRAVAGLSPTDAGRSSPNRSASRRTAVSTGGGCIPIASIRRNVVPPGKL